MSAPKKTPTEWAKETKAPDGSPNFVPCRHGWERDRYSWQHAAAAARHGWNDHKMATSEEHSLSLADYQAALEAVSCKTGPIGMHARAVSPWCTATDDLAEKAGIPEKTAMHRKQVEAKLLELAKANEAETEALKKAPKETV